MKFVFDKKVLNYQGTLGNPKRLINMYDYLKNKVEFVKPEKKINEPSIHSKELIEKVKKEDFFEPDSPAYKEIFKTAMYSLNAALTAQKIQGFSIMEPPGHHAGKNFLGGFCYFNNLAEAIKSVDPSDICH